MRNEEQGVWNTERERKCKELSGCREQVIRVRGERTMNGLYEGFMVSGVGSKVYKGPTTPCQRTRPSEAVVRISSSMVSGVSWALQHKWRGVKSVQVSRSNSQPLIKPSIDLPSGEDQLGEGNVSIAVEMCCILIGWVLRERKGTFGNVTILVVFCDVNLCSCTCLCA